MYFYFRVIDVFKKKNECGTHKVSIKQNILGNVQF